MPVINISQENLTEIMSELGFPILDFDDDFPYTEEQVKSVAVWPAMKQYFRYWPLENIQEYSISGDFSFDFPNAETFYISDARLNNNNPSGGAISPDPFVNSMNITQYGSSSGAYGTRYNYNITTAFHSRRAEQNALRNSQRAFRIHVNEGDRKVVGYSNMTGRLMVTWAEYSFDYDSISFRRIDDVKRLVQAYLMRALGNFFLMQSSDTINEIDGDFMVSRAEELEEQIIEKWNLTTKPVLIRS